MWKVRELADKVTNAVMNYTEIEAKVREATNDEAWGPTGALKHELAQATFSYDQFPEVMGMLWKRIAENKRSPRRVYKSLLLLHSLLLNGSERVVRATQDRMYELRSLSEYTVPFDPGFSINTIIPASGLDSKDAELNVRVKAKELADLVQNDEKLREERKKSRKNRDKYVGIGSDRMMTRWNDDYSYYEEEYSKNSDPQIKPFSDNADISDKATESSFKSSLSKKYSNDSFKSKNNLPRPPTPTLEEDDFNPRAGEKSDFADFASASTSSKTSVGSPKGAKTVDSNETSEFADFQSAFGSSSVGSAQEAPSLPLAAPTQGTGSKDDLFGLNFSVPGPNINMGAQTNSQQITKNINQAPDNVFDGLMSDTSCQNNASLPTFPTAFSDPPSQVPQMSSGSSQLAGLASSNGFLSSMSGLSLNATPTSQPAAAALGDLFDAPVLQPKSANGANNPSFVNIGNNNNNESKTLKGTTWSDLNISMDDLNLSKGPPRAMASNKPTINQMLMQKTSSSSTTSSHQGFGIL